ncbi:MAG: hypothetical protein RLY63_1027, partial [Chloroflexota bacterium]
MSAATPARRGLADLPLNWATDAEVARLTGILGGGDARAAAHAAFHALPTESNLLFTGYVDLRSAELQESTLLTPPATIGELPAGDLPDGAAALIHISARGIATHLGAEARAAGLTV